MTIEFSNFCRGLSLHSQTVFAYDTNAIDSKVDELVSELEVVEGHGFKPKSDGKNGSTSGPLN